MSDRKVAGIVESLANFARKQGVQHPGRHGGWIAVRAGISDARNWRYTG